MFVFACHASRGGIKIDRFLPRELFLCDLALRNSDLLRVCVFYAFSCGEYSMILDSLVLKATKKRRKKDILTLPSSTVSH